VNRPGLGLEHLTELLPAGAHVCPHRALGLRGIPGLDGGHDAPVLGEHLPQPGWPAERHAHQALVRDTELIEQEL
jgi:hypothetical protein